ncbi:MAG: hypothetical protein Q8R04_00460 [Nanoarchaeota archaeon]|nr:hypothetical protein [Nanoarchaeota archaeon]
MNIFYNKKSQAAMEFLMTYGWAILVVIAAIAALAYFGVLSPDQFLPEKCMLEPGIACKGYKVEPAKISLVIANSRGTSIDIEKIVVQSEETSDTVCTGDYSASPVQIKNGGTVTFDGGTGNSAALTCGGAGVGEAKDKFKGDITITYKSEGLSKTHYGSITTKIEPATA